MTGRLHPTDAQTYWMSAKIPNDQFLLFCFDTEASADSVRMEILTAARGIDDLSLRISDAPMSLGYPRLMSMSPGPENIIGHGRPGDWSECLDRIAELFPRQLDQTRSPWRIHLFESVTGAPRCSGPALVAVLHISHALGDGRVASSLARRLFGDTNEPTISFESRGRFRPLQFLRRSRRAQEFARTLVADTEAGVVPAQAPGRPKIRLNIAPAGRTSIRTVVRDRSEFTTSGISVTVGAITAVSVALSRYLVLHGDDIPGDLGAEVTFAKPGERRARNHFRNAGVGLFPETVDLVERARAIAASMSDRRERATHPAMDAQSLATEMVPAVLLHWGIKQFDAAAVPEAVTGNTVVSSVARGDAELHLGGGPVRFTAGFPALSPVMSVTHGVHGIGDAVTLSVTSSESAMPDPDVYQALLSEAVDDVAAAFGG